MLMLCCGIVCHDIPFLVSNFLTGQLGNGKISTYLHVIEWYANSRLIGGTILQEESTPVMSGILVSIISTEKGILNMIHD